MDHWTHKKRNSGILLLMNNGKRVASVTCDYSTKLWHPMIKGKLLKAYPTNSGARMLVERILDIRTVWFTKKLQYMASRPSSPLPLITQLFG